MAKGRVKRKFPIIVVLAVAAGSTFLGSLAGAFPAAWVEKGFAGPVFPTISHILGLFADAVPFSWLDAAILGMVALVLYCYRKRRWPIIGGLVAVAYLWFFWTWGINYHRPSLETRLRLEPQSVTPEEAGVFARLALAELNRLHPLVAESLDSAAIGQAAADRVRLVVLRIDGNDWPAASRVKRSLIADGWFRISGIEGMFNPFGHEPLVTSGLLNVEMPFCISHELAHVRGVANEGDANLIAFFATVASAQPVFQYSGWLHLWSYIRTRELDAMLDPGPAADLRAIALRIRSQQIRWASNLQSTVLDLHLKANDVKEGTASYSRFVGQAIASRSSWDRYR
jgi:hypothetical protein